MRAQFEGFVRGTVTDTSARRWEKSLGRDLYQQWRDLLIGSGYARWRNENDVKAGWVMTSKPLEVIYALQDKALDTPPQNPQS